jgi:hypothetical protein
LIPSEEGISRSGPPIVSVGRGTVEVLFMVVGSGLEVVAYVLRAGIGLPLVVLVTLAELSFSC